MGSKVAKCQPHKDKGLLFVYPRKEKKKQNKKTKNFFLDGTRESFGSCMCVLQQFVSMSGLNINVDKTKAVWIGSGRN